MRAAKQRPNEREPLWEICIRTTSEAEDAVSELLENWFRQPVSSYTDVETGEVRVAVYLSLNPLLVGTSRCDVPARAVAGGIAPLNAARTAQRAVPARLKARLAEIRSRGLDIGPGRISLRRIRREDWAESWKRHFKPIEVGSRLLVKPSWSKRRAKKGQAVVVLDPGLSFGTGQHPTTEFCLRQLVAMLNEHFDRSPLWFLDIGTGSGILAIAAAKLGYAPVDAFDFDAEAVRIARENARRNRVPSNVHITRGDITRIPVRSGKKYDLICANLISTLLVAERRRILARLKQDGVLVLAGILKSEFSVVRRVYESAGLKLITSRVEKEWCSGAFGFR